jgi:hypothetical protein
MLFIFHIRKITRRDAGWLWSIYLLLYFCIVFGLSLLPNKEFYDFVIRDIHTPLNIAILSYVGFYMLVIWFRAAWTARSPMVLVLLLCSFFGLMLNAPIGEVIHPALPEIGRWLRDVPNVAAQRGLTIGIAVGQIAIWLRSMLGYERAYMGE